MDYNHYSAQYPELYYRIYPRVMDCINRHGYYMAPEGNIDDDIEYMTDEVYEELIKECPEIDKDPDEIRYKSKEVESSQRPYYGRRRLTRDIITIILLRELFRRRYPRYPEYPPSRYRPFYGPGYGYY